MQNTNNDNKSRHSILKGTITLVAGAAITTVSLTVSMNETLQMGLLSIGAITMLAAGIILLFGRG